MPAVGDKVGNYTITGVIGRGAMASVYRAHDERLNRNVALKILDPGYSLDFIFRAQFEREYGVTAQLRNDHNIPVFDAGAWEDQLYIAMMIVDGPNLGEVMKSDGPLELGRVVTIVSQVSEALDEAHSHRVVHRDVKPANILLTRHGTNGTEHAYLADFGLTLGMEGTHLTRTGGFMGTLAYSAPEQLNAAPVDGRIDEYALAATAYHMLVGEPPFVRDNEVALINAHLFDPPPNASAIRSDLPPKVGEVIARGMSKEPENRYRTVGEFARALRSASAPVLAAAAAADERRRVGRLGWAAIVAVLLVIAALGGAAAISLLPGPSQPTSSPGSGAPSPTLIAGGEATASPAFPTAVPSTTPGPSSVAPSPTSGSDRTPRPTNSPPTNPPATSTPAPTLPPAGDLPLVAEGDWSVANSPSGTSGDPYSLVGAHSRRYRITPNCVSEDDCRLAVVTFDGESGDRLGSISFRWTDEWYVYRGPARWYSRAGGSTCETSGGELIDNAFTTQEVVHIRPPTLGDPDSSMTGTKSISGTPTAAGEAAGCEPFEMAYNVEMHLAE